MQRLRDLQQQFMIQFPESPFIESAHHGFGSKEGVWTWPHHYFKRHEQLRNEPVRNLLRLGILPFYPNEQATEVAYVTDIYYNTPEDIEQNDRENGMPAHFRFDGWKCVAIQQGLYARYFPNYVSKVFIRNLRSADVSGRIAAQVALYARDQLFFTVARLDGKEIGRWQVKGGAICRLETDKTMLPAGDHELSWGVESTQEKDVEGVLLASIQFVEDARHSTTPQP